MSWSPLLLLSPCLGAELVVLAYRRLEVGRMEQSLQRLSHVRAICKHSFLVCRDCHLTAPRINGLGGFAHCHFHRKRVSAEPHHKLPDSIWFKPQCVACHPDGD